MKIRASLCKFNMHHLLDDNATTNEPTKTSWPSLHLLSYSHSEINTSNGSWEAIPSNTKNVVLKCGSIYDEDIIYDRLLCPKMSPDETSLDYNLTIEQAIRAAHAKNLPVSLHQVIRAVGNGVDPNRYKAIMNLYAVENKTFESLDKMVDILEKYNKNSHVKASPKAQSKSKSLINNTKSSTNIGDGVHLKLSIA